MTPSIRLLLVDDEWLVRAGLRTMLSGQPDVDIVGEASDGTAIRENVAETGANMVLMDIRMPKVNGLEATEALRALPDPPHVVMLTTFDSDDLVLRSLQAGASGFLLKDTPPADLIAALRKVVAGEPILSPAITRKLINRFTEPGERKSRADAQFGQLTPGEQRVAVAVARGMSNSAIAEELFVSVATVKSHISHILDKLGFNNRVQIALLVHDARPGEVL
ncbi:LuxR family two component transcriptional regulator [Williamsia limnetica]|jgi:DNA-binding NarL/FixJ family response regulator|uniref:LuxR family two component transcriptional regulator n=1 Tax=Williamsia limnetica TaxID=882452 RepID=A0A318RRD8_WILLI|nr:response regulator transcription factor [Williamsia limnetica]PYE18085.1 LuxR family two component transcriptional regulator [Williamsia limnetica]